MLEQLKKETVSSVKWSAIERFSVQFFQLSINILLARIVTPSEYGIIAILNIFIVISQSIAEAGFTNALIQKTDRSDLDYSTVFCCNMFVSILFYTIIFFAAPAIAFFYKNLQITVLLRCLGLILIIQGFAVVNVAKLTVECDFKSQAKSSIISIIFSGIVGIFLAVNGYGVWALLIQMLLNSLLNSLLIFSYSRWIPSFSFSVTSFRGLFFFGSKLMLSGLLHTFYTNVYSVYIGYKYSFNNIGFFNQSSLIARVPSISFMTVISRAIFPLQCKLQNDDEQLLSSFYMYLRVSCFLIFPMMVSLAVISKPLISVLLTDKWLPMADFLTLLSFSYIWVPVIVLNNQLLIVKGRSDFFLKSEIIKKIIGIILFIITVPYGLKVICFGIFFYNFIDMIIVIWFLKKIISTTYFNQFRCILPICLLSLLMAFLMFVIISHLSNNYFKLIFSLIIGLSFYFFASMKLRMKEFSFLMSLIVRSKLK